MNKARLTNIIGAITLASLFLIIAMQYTEGVDVPSFYSKQVQLPLS